MGNDKKVKVLMVDDDVMLGEIVVTGLKMEGYNVEYVTTLLAMGSIVKAFRPNVIVLDIEVGEGNGVDEMHNIRKYAPNTPIIFISSHVESEMVVKAIGAGGAVYLRKPFEIVELIAYIRSLVKVEMTESHAVEIGGISIDTEKRTLTHANGSIERLTAMQAEVLMTLIENANNPTLRSQLYDNLWPDGNASDASLDNIMSKLRKVLAIDTNIKIETLRKVGFELRA